MPDYAALAAKARGGESGASGGVDYAAMASQARTLYDPERKPASAEDFAPPQRDISIGNVLLNTAKSLNPLPMLQAAASDQRPEDALLGPGRALAPFARMAGAGAASEARKTAADVGRGRYSEAAGHAAATVLPLVGPAAAQAGEDIGSGETEQIERGAGSALGLVASAVAPRVAARVAPPLASIGEQVLAKGKALPAAVSRATSGVNPIVLDIASEVAGHALGAQLGIPTLARRVLGHVLESATKKAPVASANAGGRLVPAAARASLESELAAALDSPDMPPVELPPLATLQPGYTPRSTVPPQARPAVARPAAVMQAPPEPVPATTVPKAKMAKVELPAPVAERRALKAEPSGPPKRAYFLKSPEELLAAKIKPEPVTPSGSLDVADLPASWQSRVGQDLFPTTGAEAAEIRTALRQELKDRGMTTGQAIMAVSKNKDIPVAMRDQMLRALRGGK